MDQISTIYDWKKNQQNGNKAREEEHALQDQEFYRQKFTTWGLENARTKLDRLEQRPTKRKY